MIAATNRKPCWLSAGMTLVLIAATGTPLAAHTQRKTPAKPPANSLSQEATQEKEDPLAPLLQQAKDAIDRMDFAAAIDPLQKYIAQRPDDPYAHFQLGYAYAGLKRPADAKGEFSRATALDPKMAAAHLNLGLVLIDSDPASAAEAFRHAAELQPTESRPRFLAGFSLERAGQLPEAVQEYRAALVLSPKDYEIHFALGRILLRTNDAPGAEVQFKEAVAVQGDAAAARLGLANALLTQKKYEAAIDALAEYLKLNPGDRAAHFDRASALLDVNRLDDALAELDRADAGSAPAPEALKMRGEIYVRQEKWKEASDALTQALKASPQDAEVAAWLGHADIQMHNYSAAIKILGQANTQDPQSADVLRDFANALFLNEDYPEALGAMDRLAKLEPPNPGSWFVRAICYDKLSHVAEAIDAYQTFLGQDNAQHDNQDIEARHRILALQRELAQSSKKQKK